MIKISKKNRGDSGEFYVASRLAALNFHVALPIGKTPIFDLLVVNNKGNTIKLQVKTTLEVNSKKIFFGPKSEIHFSDDLFYVFIKLNDFMKLPDLWIIPSAELAEYSKIMTENYKKGFYKKTGEQRKDSGMRHLFLYKQQDVPEDWEKKLDYYHNNLDLLINF